MSGLRTLSRKVSAVIATVLLAAGFGLAATAAPTAASPGVEARSVAPYAGHYMGRDGHNRIVKFYFDGHAIRHFSVNGHIYVHQASVSGGRVHHTCDHTTHKCVRGHWFTDVAFQGIWNDPNQGHESAFQLHLYAH